MRRREEKHDINDCNSDRIEYLRTVRCEPHEANKPTRWNLKVIIRVQTTSVIDIGIDVGKYIQDESATLVSRVSLIHIQTHNKTSNILQEQHVHFLQTADI
jgi:hypothetical protein